MILVRKCVICSNCRVELAPRSLAGQPWRPRWPGYEVRARMAAGHRYMQIRCANCDGPPPLGLRQLAILLSAYTCGVAALVVALAEAVKVCPDWLGVGVFAAAGSLVVAMATQARQRWSSRGGR